jgi:uncharacterized protein (TIGR03083 family)
MIPGLLGSPFTMSIVDLGPAAQRLADLVTRVGDDELGLPTPCPAYTLGDLIDHVGGLALAFTAAANKDSGRYVNQTPSGDASRLGEGWRVRMPRDLAALAGAWREPGAPPAKVPQFDPVCGRPGRRRPALQLAADQPGARRATNLPASSAPPTCR